MSRQCFVLVHGAWHGAWAWQSVAKRLRDFGHQVVAVDLPGYGSNKGSDAVVSLDSYIEHVGEVIQQQKQAVILVGHGMAGAVISGVAERFPQRICHLIYVAAFLLPSGDSILSRLQIDQNQTALAELRYSEDQRYIFLEQESARRNLYNRCDETSAEAAVRGISPQASFPLMAALKLSEQNFGSIPRSYVRCMHDRMLHPATQAEFIADLPCRRVIDLEADHAPFFSASDGLSRALMEVASQEVHRAA